MVSCVSATDSLKVNKKPSDSLVSTPYSDKRHAFSGKDVCGIEKYPIISVLQSSQFFASFSSSSLQLTIAKLKLKIAKKKNNIFAKEFIFFIILFFLVLVIFFYYKNLFILINNSYC